jgi:hypothetical protein
VGGTIAEGEYVISALRIYSQTRPAPPSVVKAVMSIEGTTMQQVGDRDGEERRYTSTFTVSGTTVSIEDTCPQSNLDTPSFNATPTSLSLFSESQGEVFEIEFTKR